MRRVRNAVVLLRMLPFVGWLACSELKATGPDVQTVSVALSQATLPVGQSVTVVATLRDASGLIVDGAVDWSVANPSVASRTSATGNTAVFAAMGAGATQITATSNGQSGSAMLTVTGTTPPPGPAPVASVSVALAAGSLTVGQTTQATATTRDASNNVLTGRTIAWQSSSNAIATVSSSGLVSATGSGTAQITATSEGQSGSASVTVTAVAPAPVATVTVSLASSSLVTGETTQATATTRDASNNVLTGRTIAWSSNNAAAATVSPSGLVTAAGPGTAQITATSETKTGSATVTVTAPPPPPPPPGGSNEPSGMTVITDRPFNSTTPTYVPGEAGWEDWSGTTYLTIVQDATAPKSPSNVAQLRYPAGYSGGSAPGGGEYNLRTGGRNPTTLYIAIWVKLSSNWYGNPSGVNKLYHVWISGINRVVASATGEASNPLVPQIRLQTLGGLYSDGVNPPSEDANLNPNIAGQTNIKFIRGRWYKWEVVMSGGTAGGSNGTMDWWIDGVQVGHYTGIPYIPPGGRDTWDIFKWDPTWGGIGGNVPADQFMYMDHIYISGKP